VNVTTIAQAPKTAVAGEAKVGAQAAGKNGADRVGLTDSENATQKVGRESRPSQPTCQTKSSADPRPAGSRCSRAGHTASGAVRFDGDDCLLGRRRAQGHHSSFRQFNKVDKQEGSGSQEEQGKFGLVESEEQALERACDSRSIDAELPEETVAAYASGRRGSHRLHHERYLRTSRQAGAPHTGVRIRRSVRVDQWQVHQISATGKLWSAGEPRRLVSQYNERQLDPARDHRGGRQTSTRRNTITMTQDRTAGDVT